MGGELCCGEVHLCPDPVPRLPDLLGGQDRQPGQGGQSGQGGQRGQSEPRGPGDPSWPE